MIHFKVTFHEKFAYVNFDMPNEKVNKFNAETLIELTELLDQIEKKSYLEWVLFDSNKPGIFIAGADIKEINNVTSVEEGITLAEKGQEIFNRVHKLKPRTVALIDGVALGGGLEFALACNYIVVTNSDKVKMGLPEVNLGIIPGWGGTQRLPRRIGLLSAIQYITTGKTMNGSTAIKLKLADAMVSSQFRHDSLINLIKSGKLKRKIRKRSIFEYFPGYKSIVIRQAKKAIQSKTNGHYPAPFVALDVIKRSFNSNIKKGLKDEAKAIGNLFLTPIAKNLIFLFFAQEQIKRNVRKNAIKTQIQYVGICGAGLMGGGIAWWFVNSQQFIRFKDVSWEMIQKGYQATYKIFKKGVRYKKIEKYKLPQLMDRISGDISLNGFESMDLVIEAVPEDMELKKRVFKELEASVGKQSIISSNTSSLSINEMADSLQYPERFLGIHFFSPVNKMPLVEVIPSKHTSKQVINDVCHMVAQNKKFPIVVQDCPGFLINRILLPYVNEAIYLMVQGYRISDIDNVAVKFGMPIGPLALADEVGLDVGKKVLDILHDGYGQRMAISNVFKRIVENENLKGKKGGKGFYVYNKSSNPTMNLDIYAKYSIVMKHRLSDQDQSEILDRLILVMINEASRCIDESIVSSSDELDLAMIMGTGFPAFRGGLLRYADKRGLGEIVQRLNQLSQSVDQRFKPSKYLLNLSKEDWKFYR